MKTTSKITVYEVDGKEVGPASEQCILVEAHWNRRSFVVLTVGDRTVTVSADELRRAIENAENAHAF